MNKHGFVRRSNIQSLLDKVERKTRNELEKKHDIEIESLKNQLNHEHFLETSEKDATIRRLDKRIKFQEVQIENARKVYMEYVQDVKGVNSLTKSITDRIKELFDNDGKTYQIFVDIRDEAQGYMKNLLDNEKKHRGFLGMK